MTTLSLKRWINDTPRPVPTTHAIQPPPRVPSYRPCGLRAWQLKPDTAFALDDPYLGRERGRIVSGNDCGVLVVWSDGKREKIARMAPVRLLSDTDTKDVRSAPEQAETRADSTPRNRNEDKPPQPPARVRRAARIAARLLGRPAAVLAQWCGAHGWEWTEFVRLHADQSCGTPVERLRQPFNSGEKNGDSHRLPSAVEERLEAIWTDFQG